MIQLESDLLPLSYEQNGQILTSLAPITECNQAKALLDILHHAIPDCGWHVEMKSGIIHIWSSLHETFGVRCEASQLGKGYRKAGILGRELVERIKANAC